MPLLLPLAIGLSADGFAVSLCMGASGNVRWQRALTIGVMMGSMHGVAVTLGWMIGDIMDAWREAAPWIACLILVLLGSKMLTEGLSGSSEDQGSSGASKGLSGVIAASLATSIDGVPAGMTMPLLEVGMIAATLLVSIVVATISLVGFGLGGVVGDRWGGRAEILGGVILILMGLHFIA